MSDAPPSRSHKTEDKRGFLQKLAEMLHPGPDSKDELIETLVEAQDNEVIGAQSREMLEGVIRMADMTAGDVMVAAPRMDVINIDAPFDELLHLVIDTARLRLWCARQQTAGQPRPVVHCVWEHGPFHGRPGHR